MPDVKRRKSGMAYCPCSNDGEHKNGYSKSCCHVECCWERHRRRASAWFRKQLREKDQPPHAEDLVKAGPSHIEDLVLPEDSVKPGSRFEFMSTPRSNRDFFQESWEKSKEEK